MKTKISLIFLCLAATLLLGACSNGTDKYYTEEDRILDLSTDS